MNAAFIAESIERFRLFLCAAWDSAIACRPPGDAPDFMNDWLQANWECLVEASLPAEEKILLQYYGDGSDLNPPSGRVVWPEAKPTHEVVVRPLSGDTLHDLLNDTDVPLPDRGLRMGKLTSRSNGWFEERPPFDHLLLDTEDDRQVLVRLADCVFALVPYEEAS